MENLVSAVSQNLSPSSSIPPPTSYYGIHGNRKSRALTAMKLADRCCCVISNSGAWPTPLSRFDARGTFGHLGEIRTVRLLRRQLLVRFASEEACAEAMKWCDAQRGLSAEFGYTRYCRNFIRDGACRRKRCRLRHSFVQSLDDVIADPKAETASRRGLAAQQKLSAQSKSLTTRRANEPTKTIGAAHALETLPRLAQDLGPPQLLHHAHANQAFGLFGEIQHPRIISNDHVASSSDIRSQVFVKYNTPTSAEHSFQARLPAVLQQTPQWQSGQTAPLSRPPSLGAPRGDYGRRRGRELRAHQNFAKTISGQSRSVSSSACSGTLRNAPPIAISSTETTMAMTRAAAVQCSIWSLWTQRWTPSSISCTFRAVIAAMEAAAVEAARLARCR